MKEKNSSIQISLRLSPQILYKLNCLAEAAHQTKSQFVAAFLEKLPDPEPSKKYGIYVNME